MVDSSWCLLLVLNKRVHTVLYTGLHTNEYTGLQWVVVLLKAEGFGVGAMFEDRLPRGMNRSASRTGIYIKLLHFVFYFATISVPSRANGLIHFEVF